MKCIENLNTFRRNPKSIIIMSKSDSAAYYKEVNNISIFTKSLLIAHESWSSRVEAYLQKYCRDGYKKFDKKSNSGLPDSWVVFDDVELISVPLENDTEQMPNLSPLSIGANVQITGGLKLAHNTWHPKGPPTVIATLNNVLLQIDILERNFGSKDSLFLSNKNSVNDTSFLYAPLIFNIVSHDFVLAAVNDGKIVAEQSVSFRSADVPRRILNPENSICVYQAIGSENKFWSMCGTNLFNVGKTDTYISGYLGINCKSELPPANWSNNTDNLSHIDFKESNEIYSTETVDGKPEHCILRGYHVWECEACEKTSDKYKEFRFMQCVDCKISKRTRRPKFRKGTLIVSGDKILNANANFKIPSVIEREIDINDVFDGLCYLGAGSWSVFEKVASSWATEPWETLQLANDLFDLGHIDLLFDEKSGRIKSWSVSPSCIVMGANQLMFTSGFRSRKLINVIEGLFFDAEKVIIKQDKSPDFIGWDVREFGIDEIQSRINIFNFSNNKKLSLVTNAAYEISSHLPSRNEILAMSPSVSINRAARYEIFDPKTNRWSLSPLNSSGAYRKTDGERMYFYVDRQQKTIRLDFEFAKILSSVDAGLKTIKYCNRQKTVQTILGCQPPRIFRRAFVASTGLLPAIEGSVISYRCVDEKVASLAIEKIYG